MSSIRGIINILSEEISNRIAAGEVVERPASVVKELVENSIDAGAFNITVEIRDGGKRSIFVRDDGKGMIYDDAILSIQRHATSKLKNDEDLFSIRTLGFRGEALPSIASVSKMRIKTFHKKEKSGTEVIVERCDNLEIKEAPPVPGTMVEIRDIFYNVPARLKFLKSDVTENSHISAVITSLALANPSIYFKLIVDGKISLDLPGTKDLYERIYAVSGKEIAESLIEVSGTREGMGLKGYVSKPVYSRKGKSNQYIFLNGRHIKDKVINRAVYEAYRTLLPRDRHPVFFIFLDLNPASVDVNVHPTKQEVRFSRGQDIFSFILYEIQRRLKTTESKVFEDGFVKVNSFKDEVEFKTERPNIFEGPVYDRQEVKESFKSLKENLFNYEKKSSYSPSDIYETDVLSSKQENMKEGQLILEPETTSALSNLKTIGQLFNSFIILESEDRVILMDQHAAHERILYEHLVETMKRGNLEVQELLLPVQTDLSRKEKEMVLNNMELFERLGLSVEDFGGETILIRSVPAVLSGENIKNLFVEMLDTLINQDQNLSIENATDKMIQTASCKGAIKAGQKLNEAEISSLVNRLKKTNLSHTCPHGRPVLLSIEKDKILKGFLRK